jgi:hypothetical protein
MVTTRKLHQTFKYFFKGYTVNDLLFICNAIAENIGIK